VSVRKQTNRKQSNAGGATNDIRSVLAELPLSHGENRDRYLALSREIEREMAPTNIFELIDARDVADKYWEEGRLKKSQVALVDSARVPALAQLLLVNFGENTGKAVRAAQAYFSGDPTEKQESEALVKRLGISGEVIDAVAMDNRMGSLQTLDRMRTYREKSRKSIVAKHAKRQRKVEKKKESGK